MDDDNVVDDLSPRDDTFVSMKIEPDLEEAVSIEHPLPATNSSPTSPIDDGCSPHDESAFFDEGNLPDEDIEFQNNRTDKDNPVDDGAESDEDLSRLLKEFHSNSADLTASDTTSYENEYEDAVIAVENKQAKIASRESIGESTARDRIDLKVLEASLNRLRKQKQKVDAHRAREIEENEMVVSDDDANCDEIKYTPAPSREEAMNNEAFDPIDISDEEEHAGERAPTRNVKSRGGRGSKSTTRGRKPAAKAEKSRVQKKSQSTKQRGRGRRRGPTMVNIDSLLRNDIVADAAENQGAGEQPGFGGARNKKDGLSALLASIPLEERDLGRGTSAALNKAAKQFQWRGQGSMHIEGDSWRLKGMKFNLEHFQLLGAARCCERETGSKAPYGGMLADTMGYGKTIQMIATMIENQPKPEAKNKTTLIVAKPGLVKQWKDELAKFTDRGVMDNILIYRSGSRFEAFDTVKEMKKFQVIITTYNEVMMNYPKCEPPLHLVTDEAKDVWWTDYYHEEKGPLMRIRFFRVILDEAQCIKNHKSRTSKACRLLTAKYKWVMSGTPLSNCMEELFSYFNFLGVAGAQSYAQFKENYAKRTTTTMGRLDAILRTIMIRRTGADRLFDKPLVNLPALDHQTIEVDFSPIERAIYAVVRQRFINKINNWSTSGKIGQSSRHIFEMLLRLRQMCAHVFMVNAVVSDMLESEDIDKLWNAIKRHSEEDNGTGRRTAEVIGKILSKAHNGRESSTTSMDRLSTPETEDNTIDLTIDDEKADFREFLYHLQRNKTWSEIQCRSLCHLCKEIPEGNIKLSRPCGHLYCEECLHALLESAELANEDATCCECQDMITGSADMAAMEQIALEAGSCGIVFPVAAQKKGKGKKKREPDTSWLNVPGSELMSTKVQAIVSTLEKWINADSEAKIVVFTFFLPMIKVFAKICSHKGWGYQEYTGAINVRVRTKALDTWRDPNMGNKILLMSTRAGCVGLNLVEARYAVIVDPWWNQPLEDQAFSRIYRIGQKRDCVVRRFVIKDAIDTQLMLHLQKLKAKECDRVIDGRSHDKLDIYDVMRLFGPTRRDPETNKLIIENNEDDADGTDDFVMSEDHVIVDDSDGDEVSAAPPRPEE